MEFSPHRQIHIAVGEELANVNPLMEKIKNRLQQELQKKEPFIMAELHNEIRIYDSERNYYTIVTDLGVGNPFLVSLRRINPGTKDSRYPLYRDIERIVREFNEEHGLNHFG